MALIIDLLKIILSYTVNDLISSFSEKISKSTF